MLRLIKIELTKVLYGKSIWTGTLCILVIVIGFGILLNMDNVFDDSSEEQTILEEQYENSEDWKEQLQVQIELNKTMVDVYSQEEIDMKNKILEYEIDNELEPYEHNTAWDFISYTFQILNIVLIIISAWLTMEILTLEYINKTYKLVFTKLYKRWQIYVSKYIASIIITVLTAAIMMIIACIVGGILFGFDGISSRTAICLCGQMLAVSLGGKALLYILFAIIKAIAVASIAFCVAEISKNQVVTIIFTVVCALWGKMIITKFIDHGMSVGEYSLFIHYDFLSFIDSPIVKNESIFESCIIIIIHILMFLLLGTWINKKEDM